MWLFLDISQASSPACFTTCNQAGWRHQLTDGRAVSCSISHNCGTLHGCMWWNKLVEVGGDSVCIRSVERNMYISSQTNTLHSLGMILQYIQRLVAK